jgi:Tfp pilus assembly protein PilZ
MTNSPEYGDESGVTAQLKEVIRDIATFVENAHEEHRQTLLSMLLDWRIQGLLENWRHGGRRKVPRKPGSLAVRYAIQDYVFTDFIRNISPAGVFIETPEDLATGKEITLIFSSPEREEPIKIKGQIVWKIPEGVGVKFATASKEVEEMIESL